MSDPVIEAAQRAWDATAEMTAGGYVVNPYRVAKTAAREALRPIREKWEELLGPYATRLVNPEATGAIKVLEAFAPLIFTTEELNQ